MMNVTVGTTRPPSIDEQPGVDYIFVSNEEFTEMEYKGRIN